MTLYGDIENMRSAIKHAPETVDLDEVRGLLGKAQYQIDLTGSFMFPKSVHVERNALSTHLTIHVEIDKEQSGELLAWLYGEEVV